MPMARIRYRPFTFLLHHHHRNQHGRRRSFCSHSALLKPLQLAYDLHEPPPPPTQKKNSNATTDNTTPQHETPSSSSSSSSKKAPIIFLHGLFGSKKNNRSMILARDLKRPVYALDLRNHGDSPHDPIHDYPSMADDVEFFIKEHSLSHPTLIGHSMGAKTAMTLCLRHPESISNLISVDNAPIDAILHSDFARYITGMRAIESSQLPPTTKQSEALTLLEPYEPSLPIRQFLLTNLTRRRTTTTTTNNNNNDNDGDSDSVLAFRIPLNILSNALDNISDFPYKDPGTNRFEKPALFIRGTESRYVPDDVLPLIGQFFPRFELRDVHGAGHWVAAERPEEFRQAVVEFLQDKDT